MKKVVLKLDLLGDKYRQKAMKTVSGLSGVESVSLDPKDQKLTVTGDIDPVCIVKKLRKVCCTEIISVGPAKEPEKKKEEPKKVEAKKEEAKKQEVVVHPNPSMCHYPPLQPCHCFRWAEQDPNPCIICSFFS